LEDKNKTKEQLMHELRDLRHRLFELEERERGACRQGTTGDIAGWKEAEIRLMESEERYRIAIEHSNDGVTISKKGQHIYVNRKFLEMFGYDSLHDVAGKSKYMTVHPDDRAMVIEYNGRRERGEPAPPRYEFKGIRKDGKAIFVEISVTATVYQGEPATFAYFRDISERKKMEEKLRMMSIADELTGIYNRRGFLALSEQQLKWAERERRSVELFFIDLDCLKWINDTLGHKEGDRALKDVATLLRRTFRKSDIVGRMGGDEFAVLAINGAHGNRESPVKRLRATLDNHNRSKTGGYDLSLSVGIASSNSANPPSLDELIARADAAMYEEKREKQHRA
jgi:diguanylate cyclase (GGDEF)-like protein/PAS domain S-box-containing protein